jgi:hypothetical protein
MIEARIECLCAGGFVLADLGSTIRKGEVLWLPEGKARASADLRVAVLARAVSVRWEERCVVARQPIPFFVKQPNKRVPPLTPESRAPAVATTPPAPVQSPTPEQRREEVAALARSVSESVREVVQDEIQKALREVGKPIDQARLEDAVRAAVGSAPRKDSGNSRPQPSDEPLFIPSGLVSKDETPALKVASESSASDSLDDAAEALKVVRRKKKES